MAIDPVSLAITAAVTGINMLVSASRTIEGPRLKDTSATVADYGTPLNYFIGTRVLSCPCFFAKPIREVKKKRKGKGGKRVEYSGFATWASHIADHEISGVLKIWFDNHLVYDATGSGEKVYPLGSDYELEANMRIYLGGETQDPDPDMLAYIEARDGPGTCPAYRPTSYCYFENVPVEMIGNRFPAVSMLVEYFPEEESEFIAVLDFKNGEYEFQGESRTLAQMVYNDVPTISTLVVDGVGLEIAPPAETYLNFVFAYSVEIQDAIAAGVTAVFHLIIAPASGAPFAGSDAWMEWGNEDFSQYLNVTMGNIQDTPNTMVDGLTFDDPTETPGDGQALPEATLTKAAITMIPGSKIAYSGNGASAEVVTPAALTGTLELTFFAQANNEFELGPTLNSVIIERIELLAPVADAELPGLSG